MLLRLSNCVVRLRRTVRELTNARIEAKTSRPNNPGCVASGRGNVAATVQPTSGTLGKTARYLCGVTFSFAHSQEA